MPTAEKATVMIENAAPDLRVAVERLADQLGPKTFAGARVLIKPNMVGPSAPELGHTTHPELVAAVVQTCLDRGAKVSVGDNPGGINRSSRNVAKITGILDAAGDCFTPISEQVAEKIGVGTGLPLVISRAVLDADYVINLPIMKTHAGMMVTGAMKNTFGYVAGACKARVHVMARSNEVFAQAICDVFQTRPPDLNILDAITALEGNGPCHGGHLRQVGRLLGSTDALALDGVMARMMGVDPAILPVQKEGLARGLGALEEGDVTVLGDLIKIPDFKMPVTFLTTTLDEEGLAQMRKLYPPGMMATRTGIKPQRNEDKCIECGDCALNCPAEALTLDPEFHISDECIACYCCVELCTEGAMEVPDVEAYRHY